MNLDEVGTALMVRRKQFGLSQSALALMTGLSRAEISLIERGCANVTSVTIYKVARSLNLKVIISLIEVEVTP